MYCEGFIYANVGVGKVSPEFVDQGVKNHKLGLSDFSWNSYPQAEFLLLRGNLSSAFKAFQLIKTGLYRLSRIISL